MGFAAALSILHFDANRDDAQILLNQMGLQGWQQLPQFGGNRVGRHQQTPAALLQGAGLYAGPQRCGQQAFDSLKAKR
jgi:hypothetical protein